MQKTIHLSMIGEIWVLDHILVNLSYSALACDHRTFTCSYLYKACSSEIPPCTVVLHGVGTQGRDYLLVKRENEKG